MYRQFAGHVEFASRSISRPSISHVLFDFDGTISLIREGWPEVMVPMFVEMLPALPGESEPQRRQLLLDDIMGLNGKQTIYQMIQLAERIKERGGQPQEPLWYKKEYLRRLQNRIGARVEGIRNGSLRRDDFLVWGARPFLECLARRGLQLYLASGTDQADVQREAELLDITRYFGQHIYGAQDNYKTYSKKMVIDRILRNIGLVQDNAVLGEKLLAFGDGYVEIQNTKEVGGLAVAVASDEAHNGSGRVDEWKRQRLLGVGADVVIPDFRDGEVLLECIFEETTKYAKNTKGTADGADGRR